MKINVALCTLWKEGSIMWKTYITGALTVSSFPFDVTDMCARWLASAFGTISWYSPSTFTALMLVVTRTMDVLASITLETSLFTTALAPTVANRMEAATRISWNIDEAMIFCNPKQTFGPICRSDHCTYSDDRCTYIQSTSQTTSPRLAKSLQVKVHSRCIFSIL